MERKTKVTFCALIGIIVLLTAALVLTATPLRAMLFEPRVEPEVTLRLTEDPVYSTEDDKYLFVVEATVTGYPKPEIAFSRDDTLGSLGLYKVALYLSPGESYTLSAVVRNRVGQSTDSLVLTAEVETDDTGGDNDNSNNNDNTDTGSDNGTDTDTGSDDGSDNGSDDGSDTGTGDDDDSGDDSTIIVVLPRVWAEIDGSRMSGSHKYSLTSSFPRTKSNKNSPFEVSSSNWRLRLEYQRRGGPQVGMININIEDVEGNFSYSIQLSVESGDDELKEVTIRFPSGELEPDPGLYYYTVTYYNVAWEAHAEHYIIWTPRLIP